MTNKFLFELGVEEIPADLISPALRRLSEGLQELLKQRQIPCPSATHLGTPRRLSVLLEGLPDQQSDREETIMGPPKSAAYDPKGQATKAAEGFARKNDVSVKDLELIETERGPYVGHRKNIPGKPVPEILLEIVPEVVGAIVWPKTMYWRASRFRFIRPLRWCVALWNQEVIPLEFEGIRAGRTTRGHRFLGAEEIELTRVDDYLDQLRKNYVLVDIRERAEKIAHEMDAETPKGTQVVSDPELLEMVVNLNEFPSVIRGGFNDRFLDLPKEVLITVMRHHQKYFSLVNESGEIQPYFLTIANTDGDPSGKIQKGHERVLTARLEDAAFFWESDGKKPLQERIGQLDQILFQDKLGSYGVKTGRLRLLCAQLHEDPNLESASNLCKADLTTDMVREFPELQGIMGGLYGCRENYPEPVWKAIYEHYRPVSLKDESPSTPLGTLLSVADKLDTLVGCFSVGIIPTGSSDPFALRRQAQSLVKIMLDHRLEYSLGHLVELAQKSLPAPLDGERQVDLLKFMERRLRHVFQQRGVPYDVLNAVLSVASESVYRTFEKSQALSKIRGEEDFEALAIAYKRIKNILIRQAEEVNPVSQDALTEPEEKALFDAYSTLHPKVETLLENQEYLKALKEIAGLRGVVDQFFDKVLVMTKEEKLRRNRLGLLYDISQLFLKIADISEIVHEGSLNKAESTL